jgi:nicotinamide-nucleotide amidase
VADELEIDGHDHEASTARRPRVATAESLTGGLLSNALAVRKDAAEWYLGGVVAYARSVKEQILQIGDAPVVSERAVRAMADNVARLLGADLSVAVTGVGGPGSEDGVSPGTVWIAVHGPRGTVARLHHFDGDPEEICTQTRDVAVAALDREIQALDGASC